MNPILVMALLLFMWPFSSGKKYHLKGNDSVPAASGTVKVQSGDNGNTRLDIKVHNLARPSSLTPAESVYIVWIRPHDGVAEKKGAITLNKNLDGELKVITVARNFDVLITGEQSPGVSEPEGPEVLQTHIDTD